MRKAGNKSFFSRFLQWFFLFLLLLLLTVQAPAFYLFVLKKELQVPSGILSTLINRYLPDNYSVTIGNVSVRPDGIIQFTDVNLHNDGAPKSIVFIPNAEIHTTLGSILSGKGRFNGISCRDINIHIPGRKRGDFADPILVDSIVVFTQGDHWYIHDLRAKFGNINISAYGQLSLAPFEKFLEPKEPSDIDLAPRIQSIMDWTQKLDNPYLSLMLSTTPEESQRIEANFLARAVYIPGSLEINGPITADWIGEIHQGAPHTHILSFGVEELTVPESFTLEAPRIYWKPTISHVQAFLENFFGDGPFQEADIIEGRETINLQARRLLFQDTPLDSPVMKIFIPLYPTAVETIIHTYFLQKPLSVKASLNPFEESARIEVLGELDFHALKQSRLLPEDFANLRVEFPEFLAVDLQTELSPGWHWDQPLKFDLQSGELDLVGLQGVAGAAEGSYDPVRNELRADAFHFESRDYHLSGSYRQDLHTDDFRFLVYGNFQPTDINNWMSDWWSNIWVDFALPYPPYIDFDISGNWRDSDNRFVFGGFRFIETTIRGLHLNQGRASIRSYPYLFEMFNLYATRPEGVVMGSTANILDTTTKKDYAERYKFICTLDIQKAAPLFGKRVTELLETFSFTKPPRIEVSGVVFPNNPPRGDHAESLQVKARSDHPLVFRGVELEHLDFIAEYGEEKLFLSELYFGLGGGTGEGWAMIHMGEEEETPLRFALEFHNGTPAQVVAKVPALAEAIGNRFQAETDLADDENNRLDFMIEASGDPDDLASFLGAGEISIKADTLADIHLLGLLSRIINELPLPITLGSFNFNSLRTSFLLNRGLVELPDLSLSSPSSRLSAAGEYRMSNQTIDFDVRVYLMGEMNVPILSQISQIFRPLANVFEFRLWGEFEDLNWRLNLDPRNLFTVPVTDFGE